VSVAPFDFGVFLAALPLLLIAAALTWLLSLALRNVSLADPLWSMMLFTAGVVYALGTDPRAPRLSVVLWLLAVWAIRLAFHLTVRYAGKGEIRRYHEMRERHSPHFGLKSLYLVFLPRAFSAWIVSVPLLGAFASNRPLGILDQLGAALCVIGIIVEAVSDRQLARFARESANANGVLTAGLWGFSRHPNYFGEVCVWWGFWLIACGAGGWWSIVGPAFLTVLLWIRGVRRQERDIGNRRPQYANYVLKTNAFFPGPHQK
jgi:steroid 5-alpha reductase family enzyme